MKTYRVTLRVEADITYEVEAHDKTDAEDRASTMADDGQLPINIDVRDLVTVTTE